MKEHEITEGQKENRYDWYIAYHIGYRILVLLDRV